MALVRADFIDPDGNVRTPLTGAIVRSLPSSEGRIIPDGDYLTRHMQTMRPVASEAAQRAEADILISRIVKGGAIRPSLIATFDGRFRRPDTSKSAGANADHKDDGPCFCAACRADRRVSRAKGVNR